VSKCLNADKNAIQIRGNLNPLTPSLTDRTDIIERMLVAAQGDTGLTERRMIYEFSLPNVAVDLYLSSMIRNELLKFDSLTRAYRTTEKGSDFLKTLRQMYELDGMTD
jgi:predicted transcriptional regulator